MALSLLSDSSSRRPLRVQPEAAARPGTCGVDAPHQRRRAPLLVLMLPLTLILVVCIASAISRTLPALVEATPAAPGYTIAEVRAGLAHDPGWWERRELWVQGMAVQCPLRGGRGQGLCSRAQPVLADPAGLAEPLPLAAGAANPVLAILGRLALLGPLVPVAPPLQWGMQASYRVELRAAPAGACDAPPCVEAMLLDTAP